MTTLPVVGSAAPRQHDLEPERIVSEIRARGAKTVGLQFPEGLKKEAFAIARLIEKETGADVFISADPCFGACDLDRNLIECCDVLFHFGHAPLEHTALEEKVCFIETRSNVSAEAAVRGAVDFLSGTRIGLITTVQHVGELERAARLLVEAGKVPVIGKGDDRTVYPGQVLGCNFSAARDAAFSPEDECDEFLFIGSGQFHPIGVALSTKKRVVCADPYTAMSTEVSPRKYLMQRSAVIGNASDAQTFGILVSVKNGQRRQELAQRLRKLAEKHEKEAFLIFMDLITPDRLLSFRADAFVNTACPRLAIDDSGNFPAPVLTPQEFEIVLGEKEWEDLVMDEILEGERR